MAKTNQSPKETSVVETAATETQTSPLPETSVAEPLFKSGYRKFRVKGHFGGFGNLTTFDDNSTALMSDETLEIFRAQFPAAEIEEL